MYRVKIYDYDEVVSTRRMNATDISDELSKDDLIDVARLEVNECVNIRIDSYKMYSICRLS